MAMAKKIPSKVTGVRNPGEHESPTKALLVAKDKKDVPTKKTGKLDAAIKPLVKDITEDDAKVKTIAESQATETALRDENHAEMVSTIKDSQDAQAAPTNAIQALKNFYKESGMVAKEPWEFLQTGDVELPERPATGDSSYTGTADPQSGAYGILTILDETMPKFSRMKADIHLFDILMKTCLDEHHELMLKKAQYFEQPVGIAEALKILMSDDSHELFATSTKSSTRRSSPQPSRPA